jgi:hypothetical protein
MKGTTQISTPVILLIIALVVCVVCLIYYCKSGGGGAAAHEPYADFEAATDMSGYDESPPRMQPPMQSPPHAAYDTNAIAENEEPQPLDGDYVGSQASVPKDCFPKDQLSPQELLPADANSTWAQVNPCGQGNVGDENLLTAGHHVGINTVGQTLRNANLQLRSEPPNPQMKVSPWMQSTIEPDSNRRGMEIGGD